MFILNADRTALYDSQDFEIYLIRNRGKFYITAEGSDNSGSVTLAVYDVESDCKSIFEDFANALAKDEIFFKFPEDTNDENSET